MWPAQGWHTTIHLYMNPNILAIWDMILYMKLLHLYAIMGKPQHVCPITNSTWSCPTNQVSDDFYKIHLEKSYFIPLLCIVLLRCKSFNRCWYSSKQIRTLKVFQFRFRWSMMLTVLMWETMFQLIWSVPSKK